jgi:amino acid adenylation domain-containing protein
VRNLSKEASGGLCSCGVTQTLFERLHLASSHFVRLMLLRHSHCPPEIFVRLGIEQVMGKTTSLAKDPKEHSLMTNSLRTDPSRSVDISDKSATAGTGRGVAEGTAGARHGADLLGHLPVDRSSRGPNSLTEASYGLANEQLDRVSRACAALQIGRDAFLLTAFATLLARLAGQEVVTLGNVAADRAVLTLSFDDGASFRSLLSTRLSVSASSNEPCAVEFVSATPPGSLADLPEQCLRMTVSLSDSGCQVHLASTTARWDQSLLHLWLYYFDSLVAGAAATPDIPWKTLPLLDPIDAWEHYRALNDTAAPYPADACVHELVMQQVQRSADAPALASERHQLTYRQLDQRSNGIARRLRLLGAGPGRCVAVCMERAADLPVALLGILKAGAYYVPLDLQDAPQRLESILDECRPAAVIADPSFPPLHTQEAVAVMHLDDVPEVSAFDDPREKGLTPDHPAYMIYTSGTTGKPKGVAISHRSLVNLLHSIAREPGFTSRDRMLGVAPISFDIATMDMFLPLVSGGTLVVADRFAAGDPNRLSEMLERFEITVLQATPVTWRLLTASGWQGKRDLKMISGGEALPRDLANQLLPLGEELWNCYGPTETTIWSAVLKIQSEPGAVTVGPPIANTTLYVLDETGRLLPPGVPGELYIGGIGLSSGYVDRPQITRERFLPDPYSQVPGARMFKTGDLVRLVNKQEFEFFGRLDQQVKLRGYRIELGEIEAALRSFPGIENAAAALRDNGLGEPYLVAFVTATSQQPDLRRLRDHLSQLLPSYMVPSRFVVLEAMPLTSSGKVDRKALPASNSLSGARAAYQQPEGVKPQTELEERLLAIFREVLNTAEFGVTDNFFDYGGYSLLTVKLFTRIYRALHVSLPISLLFDAPTVRTLAAIIDCAEPPPMIVPIRPRGRYAPLFVVHSYLLYGVLPQIVEPDRPVYGVRELLDVPPEQSVEERAATYVKEILKVNPSGPLLLAGWCAAGSLTVEIARQLHDLNHQVGLVALFDAERPGYRPAVRAKRAARVISSLKFHSQRIRAAGGREKLAYVRDTVERISDTMMESLFTNHRPHVLNLQRVLGFALPDAVFNNTWSRVAAIQNHAPAIYPGRVMLFRAADVPHLTAADETLGWKEVVQEPVEVVFVPGDHETMFHDPHADFFGRRLRQALQQSE